MRFGLARWLSSGDIRSVGRISSHSTYALRNAFAPRTRSRWNIFFSLRSRLSADNDTNSVVEWYHCRPLPISRDAISNLFSASVRSKSVWIAWTFSFQISHLIVPAWRSSISLICFIWVLTFPFFNGTLLKGASWASCSTISRICCCMAYNSFNCVSVSERRNVALFSTTCVANNATTSLSVRARSLTFITAAVQTLNISGGILWQPPPLEY